MSNNCLVTRLKAVVNDDSLPVIETMQQFTLDAIVASENNAMTESQKLALNHFFYAIGAVGNTGIYPKLSLLSLPMIGGSVAGALNNYVDNTKPSTIDNRLTLVDNHIESTVNGTISAGTMSLSKSVDTSNFVWFTKGVFTEKIGHMLNLTDSSVELKAGTIYVVFGNTPYTTRIDSILSNLEDYDVASLESSDGNASSLFLKNGNISSPTVSKYEPINTGLHESITFRYSKGTTKSSSTYFDCIGEGLTNDEKVKMLIALHDLYEEFVV